jgi:hypothetical protein
MNNSLVFRGEMQLLRWSETSNAGATVTFQLAEPAELERFKTMTLAKRGMAGQRLAVMMAEIGDDEQPIEQPKEEQKEEPELKGGALAKWVSMRCNEPEFWRFLGKLGHTVTNSKEAAEAVRRICNVQSRKEFDTDPAAEQRFHERIRIPFGRFLRGQNVP